MVVRQMPEKAEASVDGALLPANLDDKGRGLGMGTREGCCLGIGLHCRFPGGQMGSDRWGESFLRVVLGWRGAF